MGAQIVLKVDREKSLKRYHPWVFDGAIESVTGKPRAGATVDIVSSSGEWLAKAAYSPQSQIRARVWSFVADTIIDNNFFKNRIKQAYKVRQQWLSLNDTNAYRLIAGESDGLPGVTIDLYDSVAVIQLLSVGADKHRDKIIAALKDTINVKCIHERSDVDVRKKEGLEPLIATHFGSLPDTVTITENGLKINVDLIAGHKTGFYLDQRKNRRIAGQYCTQKTVLNCFSYTGTFSLYALNANATHVTNLDVSTSALSTSKHNIFINFGNSYDDKVSHCEVDVFEQLRTYKKEGKRFDVIILDPPKFIENKRHLVRAARGYKDINRLACEILNENGVLITFSCSGLMSTELFNKVVADAAQDANTHLRVIERLHQDSDHPVASSYPEGHYLKGLIAIKQTIT